MVSMVAGSATAAEVTAPAERPSVSDFTLTNLEGKRVKLSSLTGKVVLVSFWATWCAPCKQELPFLDTFAARYADKASSSWPSARTAPSLPPRCGAR